MIQLGKRKIQSHGQWKAERESHDQKDWRPSSRTIVIQINEIKFGSPLTMPSTLRQII